MIQSTSQVDPTIGQMLDGISNSVRNQQVDNWSQTMGNILAITGGQKQESSVLIEKYENGIINKDFNIKKNDGASIGTPNGAPKETEQRSLPAKPPAPSY
jgi:hypothetical protein